MENISVKKYPWPVVQVSKDGQLFHYNLLAHERDENGTYNPMPIDEFRKKTVCVELETWDPYM